MKRIEWAIEGITYDPRKHPLVSLEHERAGLWLEVRMTFASLLIRVSIQCKPASITSKEWADGCSEERTEDGEPPSEDT